MHERPKPARRNRNLLACNRAKQAYHRARKCDGSLNGRMRRSAGGCPGAVLRYQQPAREIGHHLLARWNLLVKGDDGARFMVEACDKPSAMRPSRGPVVRYYINAGGWPVCLVSNSKLSPGHFQESHQDRKWANAQASDSRPANVYRLNGLTVPGWADGRDLKVAA